MPLPTPLYTPIKRKECLAVSSWRSTSPEPQKDKDDGCCFTRIALVAPVTKEGAILAVKKALSHADIHQTFTVGPAQQVHTKKSLRNAGDSTTPVVSPAANPKDDEEDTPPAMSLPPAIADNTPMQVFRFTRSQAAEEAKTALLKAYPNAVVSVTQDSAESHLPTLVLKGIPFNFCADRFLDALNLLTTKPCHLRLQRGDRGMFKCVLFVKYPSAVAADIAKVELERFYCANKPLKVEHKKRARRFIGSQTSPQDPPSFDQLRELVADLKVSKENEAFTYPKGLLTKDEQKFLKNYCLTQDVIYEAADSVTVRRRTLPPPEKSPSMRPSSNPVTPPWQIATPAGLAPKDGLNFRGIRSWKEAREGNHNFLGKSLPIVRPIGPNDTAAFGAGRGRPASGKTDKKA